MTPKLNELELWFLTGSQHLYGAEALRQVAANSQQLIKALNDSGRIPSRIVFKKVQTTPEEIRATCLDASHDNRCIGVILWMHTFSPSKMWITGLKSLTKPILHLHTQFNRDLPWSTIDMDFMNLNQAAHGDREAGYIHTRMRLNRKVVVGHWSESEVQDRIGVWNRAAAAWHDLQGARFGRIGDNMRFVAVTEGDKTAAESTFGYSVNTYGVGDVVKSVNEISDADVTKLVNEYEQQYELSPDLKTGQARHKSVRDAARIELGLRAFLVDGNFKGFTTTFEDLHGLRQLPGLAPQRLMADGYGFAGEGDWKTAALLRAMKVMAAGLKGGTSFMEDYTYHLYPENQLVLGSHMLEICPSIASSKPKLEVHPLGIGGKEDPARLVFEAPAGAALNCSMIDLGNRFRLVLNEVDVVTPPEPMPKLPVARAVWKCRPNFKTSCAAWIHAGGAHHSGFSYAVTAEHLEDFANIAGIELAKIDANTELGAFRKELRDNEVYRQLATGFRGL